MKRIALLAMMVLAASAGSTRAQGVAGKWKVAYDMRVEREGDGAERVTMRGEATLSLEQKGDSVIGTWVPAAGPNTNPRPVRGKLTGNTVKFESGPSEARVNMNGNEQKFTIMSYFDGTVDRDTMHGTMLIKSQGNELPAATRNWDAKRAQE